MKTWAAEGGRGCEGGREAEAAAHAGTDLPRVTLAPGHAAEAAVEVLARLDVAHRVGHVDRVQSAEQRCAAEGAVGEARVHLAPLVAEKGAVGLLQTDDVPEHRRRLQPVERVEEDEDLHCAQRVEHVRVVTHVAAEAAALVLAAHDEIDDHGAVHVAQGVDQDQRRDPPVDATHPKVLRDGKSVGLAVLAGALDEGAVQCHLERRLGQRLVRRPRGDGIEEGHAHVSVAWRRRRF